MTHGAYRDLQPFVDDNFGRVPVFGYPLVCYSPRDQGQEFDPKQPTVYYQKGEEPKGGLG